MITFETQEDFENAVMEVLCSKLNVKVECFGYPFVTGVRVGLHSDDDRYSFTSWKDAVA